MTQWCRQMYVGGRALSDETFSHPLCAFFATWIYKNNNMCLVLVRMFVFLAILNSSKSKRLCKNTYLYKEINLKPLHCNRGLNRDSHERSQRVDFSISAMMSQFARLLPSFLGLPFDRGVKLVGAQHWIIEVAAAVPAATDIQGCTIRSLPRLCEYVVEKLRSPACSR